jgi:hypothetical protein
MTQTPFIDEEELKRLEAENAAEEQSLEKAAPSYDPQKNAPETTFQEATPQQNQAAGNVQPVQSAQQQGIQQLLPKDPIEAGRNILEGGFAAPIAALDFGMDAIGRIPGAEWIDDAWDAQTKFKNPVLQNLREAASIIVPSIAVGVASGGTAAAVTAGGVARGLTALGINAVGDVGVNLISDQSEGENLTTFVKKTAPWMPVFDGLVVKDTDSPEVRRQKNIYESAGLSIVGDLIGYAISAGKPIMDWFKPKDATAKAYKAGEAMVNADAATATRLSELDTQRAVLDEQGAQISSAVPLTPEEAFQQSINLDELGRAAKELQNESTTLTTEYLSQGHSRLTENPLESFVERQQTSRDLQIDEIGKEKLMLDPQGAGGVDPYITPSLFPEGSSAAFSVPPGNVARNMADTTAIKFGSTNGSPAPILSERAYYDLSNGNTVSRNIIFDLAESTRATGEFDAVVDGFRYTKAQMSEAAWKIYNDIIGTNEVSDLQKLFMDNRDVKHLLDGRSVKYVNDVQAEAIGYAMRDLTDKYVGRVVNEASARAMDTVGREISDIAEGYKALPETADYERVTEMLGDRLAFLMEEYSVNKYIAGWALKAQDRWKMMFQKSADKEIAIKQLMDDFDLKVQEKHAQAQGYRDMISRIATERPDAAQALIDAFALSKGNVDTLDKLMKWSAQQMSPMGLLKGSEDGLNAFAQGVWSVRYNNVLSGLSAARAITGNAVSLTLRPINTYLGTGLGMLMGRNSIDDLKRANHVYSSMWATHTRALGDAWDTFKRTWNNGHWGNDATMDVRELVRDDLVTDYNPDLWQALGNMEKVWEKEGNTGRLMQYRFTRFLYDLGNWRWHKYGTNALISADSYLQTTVANQLARFRAYDEVMGIGYKGAELTDQLAKAEKLAYGEMFDSAGNITDQALKYSSGEIALNLDDATASFLSMGTSRLPILKPFFMFPKTGVNGVKIAMSYTPLAMIPGMSRYAKVLQAGDNIDLIREAMLEHGIQFDSLPNGMAVFKGLEAEYRGRVAFGSLLFAGLMGHALAGNIRGNGPVNASERKKLRDNFGWKPKHINIGGKWISYAGYEPLDTVLSLVGDLGYYATDIGSTLTEDIGTKIAWSFAATFANKTWTAGLEPLVSVINGDQTAVTRMLANEVRSAIPWSGALGVAADAISSTQKDIYNDLIGYVTNRLPGLNANLPEQIDIYTGTPLNDIDNPILRAVNAVNPVKISEGTEPWRQWLIDSGWDGLQMIRKDSTGNHEYTSAEREVLYRYIGEQQIWKEFDKLSKNKKYNDQLDRVRAMRVQGRPKDEVDVAQSEVYSVMNQIMTNAQKAAELRLQNENQSMWNAIQESIRNKNYMQQGRVDDAARAADRRKAEIERLTQMYR